MGELWDWIKFLAMLLGFWFALAVIIAGAWAIFRAWGGDL